MLLTLLKAKLHRARVTGADLNYEGSIGIDVDLLTQAGILVNERVEVYNIDNGHRLATYAIALPSGSGAIVLNGAAARLAAAGDRVIICAYAIMEADQAPSHIPRVVLLDEHNRPLPSH